MHNFKKLSTVVQAVRIGADGSVQVPGRGVLIADAGTWLVLDSDGTESTWTHAEFLRQFEPVDEEAVRYLVEVA